MAKRNKPKTTRQENQAQELAKQFYNYFVFYNAHPSNKDIKINGDQQSLEIFAEVLAELAFDTLEKYITKEIQLHIKQIQKIQSTPLHYNRSDSQSHATDLIESKPTTSQDSESQTTSHTEQSEVYTNEASTESRDQVSQIDTQSNNVLTTEQEKDTREFILKLLFENQQDLKDNNVKSIFTTTEKITQYISWLLCLQRKRRY